MGYPRLRLSIQPQVFTVLSLPPDSAIPDHGPPSSIISITRTSKELTIVCDADHVPDQCDESRRWKCIKVEGSFGFDAIGVIASLAEPLTLSKISLYVVSTYDTDYVLIQVRDIDAAVSCLTEAGHTFVISASGSGH